MKLILSFIMSLLFVSTLSANCGKCDMKGMQKKCDTPNCKMKEMKKENCKCGMKKENCKMPKCNMKEMKKSASCGAGKCGANMKSGSCGAGKCGANMKNMDMKPAKKEAKMCGCGMTQESCEKMMPKCKFRDQRKAQEAK